VGLTRRATECLCLRLLRNEMSDRFLIHSSKEIPLPSQGGPSFQGWWASSLILWAGDNLTNLMVNGLPASGHSHLSSWIKEILSPLSLEGLRFLTTYDLCCIEELLIEEDGEYLPLPWLLKEGLQPGGPDVFKAVEQLLLAHGSKEMGGDIPIVKKQCYMLSPLSYFCVAGILLDGRVSGRFYCPMPLFITRLVLDASRPSQARGSGFDTSVAVSDLRGPGVRRAITCLGRGKHFWTVLHILETKRLATPPSLPACPNIPPLPPCLLPVVTFLWEQNSTPVLMSSDASFEYAGGPPCSVFNDRELAVANCTACIMVADSSFPLSGPSAVAVIIHGIERIRHGKPFIGELVGGTDMSYLRSPFSSLLVGIEADMDCGAVTTLQNQQIHLLPDQVSAQHRVYGAVLRAFLQGRGDHP
jgi:hypothetical protein